MPYKEILGYIHLCRNAEGLHY